MRYLLSTFLVFYYCVVNAQMIDSTAIKQEESWSLKEAPIYWKFSPFDFISILSTFGADAEVRVNKTYAFQAGIGVIPNFSQFMTNRIFVGYDSMNGYKLRGELRRYMPVKTNRYLAAGVLFRHLIVKDEFAVGMEPFSNQWGGTNFVYFQRVPIRANRININLDLKYGFQTVKPQGYVFDFYVGMSLRSLNVINNSEMPDGVEFPDNGDIWSLNDNMSLFYPTPIAGLKIGFAQR